MIEPLGCKVHPRSAPRFRRSQPCAGGWCCSERPEGKGTRAHLLNQRLGAGDLSTRDVLRAAGSRKACERTPAVAAALDYDLVPDSTVLGNVARAQRLPARTGRVPAHAGVGRGPLPVDGKGESRAKCRDELRIAGGGNRVSPGRPPDLRKVQGGLSRHEPSRSERHLR